jgi:hypothetical protein
MLNELMKLRMLKALLMIPVLAFFVSMSTGATENKLSRSELKRLIATAETKADHERIAEYFDSEAARYDSEAKEHSELAQFYDKNPSGTTKYPGTMQTSAHCTSLSKSLRQAAEDARALAAAHRKMAEEAKK